MTRRGKVDQARLAAFDVLREVLESDSYANLLLPRLLKERGIDGRDAAFATELTYGALRMQAHADWVLEQCVDRALQDVDTGVLALLRLGTYQMLYMRVPTHAAVDSTVEIARHVLTAGPTAFINAVLRKVSARTDWLDSLPRELTSDALALRTSHPRWIVNALHEALASDGGQGWEETEALLRADNEAADVTLVVRPGKATLEEFPDVTAGRWTTISGFAPAGSPSRFVRDHRVGVQDEGSQMVALALAAADVDGPDQHWVDACAGPGGKAALLAAIADLRGARVTAVEAAPHRAALVRDVVPAPHEVLVGDSTALHEIVRPADRILIDAPCTGLGALRRRPESRWRRTPADLATLSTLQRELLESAMQAVRVGGVIGYATCSPHRAETDFVVGDALKRHADFERLNAVDALCSSPYIRDSVTLRASLGEGPDVRLWPHRHHTDGMYLALLRRTS